MRDRPPTATLRRASRRWRFDAFLGYDFQRALERQLDLARCLFTRVAVRHDSGPFDDLSNEAFVAFFRRPSRVSEQS